MADLSPYAGITRIQPFTGLIIDPATWGAAHDYHELHQRLHLLNLHGSGIVQGLEVLPSDPPGDALVVEPGIAVDILGNVMVLAQREHIEVGTRGETVYLSLLYHEASPSGVDGATADPNETRGRIVEGYRLTLGIEPPVAPALELARVALGGGRGKPTIMASPNPWAPAEHEIDARHRRHLSGVAAGSLQVAFLADGGTHGHLEGFWRLLALSARSGLRVTPQYGQDGGAADSDVVYVAGDEHSQPSPALIEAVGEHLRRGAWLFADGCGDGDAFANAFVPLLMDQVGERDAEASVLGAHHVFGTPPDGAFPGELRWGPRALVSARDYGCVWCGRGPEAPTPRDRIRDALEFGVNFLAAAAHAHRR